MIIFPLRTNKPVDERMWSDSWRESLTPKLVDKIIEDHGDMMRRFGYLDAENKPVF